MSFYGVLPFRLVNGYVPHNHRGDLWFEDGTVVLLSGTTAFKVYKGLLARDSQVFADLFAAPPSHRVLPIPIEGCEVFVMEEPVSKLSPVLKWIHVGIGKRFPSYDDFDILASMFSMAEFYQLHGLREILIQPLLKYYLDRLHTYQNWDGLHSIAKPINPVHCLNFARTYDVRILSLVPIVMVDLTLFVSEAELLSAKEPRRSSPYAPGLNSSQDIDVCQELWDHHKLLTAAVGRVLTRFDADRPFSRRVRCCSFKRFYTHLQANLEKANSIGGNSGRGGSKHDEWLSESHGRYGLELILGVRTDSERSSYCETCLRELDAEVMSEYKSWWEKIPKLLGLDGGWQDEILRELQYGEEEMWSWD